MIYALIEIDGHNARSMVPWEYAIAQHASCTMELFHSNEYAVLICLLYSNA